MYVIVAGGGKVGANVDALAPSPRARGDADRAEARPLRAARGRVRAPGAARRRDRALRPRARRDRAAAGHRARAHRRRRGQHDRRPDREGEVRRAEGDRARERPAQPAALRPAGDLADDLRHLEHHGARRARGARARPDPPARAARREPRDRRGADRRRLAVGGQERRGAVAARGLAAHLRHARRPGGDRRRLDGARGGRPGARDPRVRARKTSYVAFFCAADGPGRRRRRCRPSGRVPQRRPPGVGLPVGPPRERWRSSWRR